MKHAWPRIVAALEVAEILIGLQAALVVALVAPVVSFLFWLGTVLSAPIDRTLSPWLLFSAFALSAFAAFFNVHFLAAAMGKMPGDLGSPEGPSEPARLELPWGVQLGEQVFSTHWLAVVPMIGPWLAYYLLAGAAGLSVTRWLQFVADRPNRIVVAVLATTISFAFSVAMHSYLVLALAGLFRSRAVVRAVWKWRFVIDVVQSWTVLWALERGAPWR